MENSCHTENVNPSLNFLKWYTVHPVNFYILIMDEKVFVLCEK